MVRWPDCDRREIRRYSPEFPLELVVAFAIPKRYLIVILSRIEGSLLPGGPHAEKSGNARKPLAGC